MLYFQETLKELGVTHILNCTHDLGNSTIEGNGAYSYRHVKIEDEPDFDLAIALNEAIAFIEQCQGAGGTCLVYSRNGVSRAPTVCIGFLMLGKKRGKTSMRRLKPSYNAVVGPPAPLELHPHGVHALSEALSWNIPRRCSAACLLPACLPACLSSFAPFFSGEAGVPAE